MTLEQAIRILHPMTCEDALSAVLDLSGYSTDRICEARNEAAILACEVMRREVERQAGCPSCPVSLGMGFKYCPRCGKPLNNGKVDGDE